MMRTVTVAGASIVQMPAPGSFEPLRTNRMVIDTPITVDKPSGGGYLPTIRGDALEIVATFSVASHAASTATATAAATAAAATSFGVLLRAGGSSNGCQIGYSPATKTITATGGHDGGAAAIDAGIVAQPTASTVELHIFLDRQIIETYSGGAALTSRCSLADWKDGAAAQGIDLWAVGGTVKLLKLEAWAMSSMWGAVPKH